MLSGHGVMTSAGDAQCVQCVSRWAYCSSPLSAGCPGIVLVTLPHLCLPPPSAVRVCVCVCACGVSVCVCVCVCVLLSASDLLIWSSNHAHRHHPTPQSSHSRKERKLSNCSLGRRRPDHILIIATHVTAPPHPPPLALPFPHTHLALM